MYFMNQYTVHKLMYIHVLYYKYILISILKTMHRRSMVIILNLMIITFFIYIQFYLNCQWFICVCIHNSVFIYIPGTNKYMRYDYYLLSLTERYPLIVWMAACIHCWSVYIK